MASSPAAKAAMPACCIPGRAGPCPHAAASRLLIGQSAWRPDGALIAFAVALARGLFVAGTHLAPAACRPRPLSVAASPAPGRRQHLAATGGRHRLGPGHGRRRSTSTAHRTTLPGTGIAHRRWPERGLDAQPSPDPGCAGAAREPWQTWHRIGRAGAGLLGCGQRASRPAPSVTRWRSRTVGCQPHTAL